MIGDFNARVGLMQGLDSVGLDTNMNIREKRISCDVKVNAKGRRIMECMNDAGMVVLNGRTDGHINGEFTFVGNACSSVCVSRWIWCHM